ncbi:hypothetical protein LUW77_09495 [Streptomyces radiopugnans]|nr:hypothetical protein LUW77_09495 [Streptomyces radiopugnans]
MERWTCLPRMARAQLASPPFSPRRMLTVGSLPRGTSTVFFHGSVTSEATVAFPASLRAR